MKNLICLVVVLALASCLGLANESRSHSYVPKDGFVPDEATAIRIAEAVWIPIYGEATITREKPFVVELKGEVWVVTGTLHASVGGVAVAEISKRDARIIRVSHGK